MANSDRKIIRGVQIGTTTYTSGQEDELNAAISADEVVRLKAKGYLQGDWKGKAAPLEPAKETEKSEVAKVPEKAAPFVPAKKEK